MERLARAQAQYNHRIYAFLCQICGFQSVLRVGNPGVFCFPGTKKVRHNSRVSRACKDKTWAATSGRPRNKVLQMLDALAARSFFPLLLDHPVVAAESLVIF